jgi:hypothetical protein
MRRTQRVTPDDLERLAFDTGQPIERDVDAGVMVCRIEGVDFYARLEASAHDPHRPRLHRRRPRDRHIRRPRRRRPTACPTQPGEVMTAPWPDVDRDESGQMTCPVLICDAPLYLIRTYCIPLIAEQDTDLDTESAVSDSWEVICTNDHKLHTSVDQLRATHDADETADYAPEYNHMLTHHRVNALGGVRA